MAEEDSEGMQVTLSARTLIIGAFVLGLTTGMVGGILVGSVDIRTNSGEDSGNTAKISGTLEEVFTKLAEDVGADKQQFNQCLQNSKGEEFKEDVKNIQQIAGRLGTPTFFIGNSEVGYEVVSGAQPVLPKEMENGGIYRGMAPELEEQIEEARTGDTSIEENETTLSSINLEGEPAIGDSDAPINVIEYSDYGCPYCSEWAGFDASPRIPIDQWGSKDNLIENYVDSGEVQFIYKDFPVENLHPNAPKAHVAANCVLEQEENLYWKFHDKLFEFQSSWKQ